MSPTQQAAVVLVNPLPATLSHYETALESVLRAAGAAVATDEPTVSAEMSDGAPRGRPVRAVAALRQRWRPRQAGDVRLVLWPVFGLADPVTWLRGRRGTWVVVHDPQPLRRQFGMGRIAGAAGGWVSRHGVGVIAHSEPALEVLRRRGWRVELLPMPIAPAGAAGVTAEWLTVLGQWKPARDLAPLRALARIDGLAGRRRVLGRGWPDLDGWAVQDRFVSETELTAAIASSACVLLPYARYFQSDIAMRCLELGVPVVGFRHPFLTSLYGEDWPGAVDGGNWMEAVDRVGRVDRSAILARRDLYRAECIDAWGKFADRVVSRSPFGGAQN